jgi:hypothetical protein
MMSHGAIGLRTFNQDVFLRGYCIWVLSKRCGNENRFSLVPKLCVGTRMKSDATRSTRDDLSGSSTSKDYFLALIAVAD